MNTKPKFNQGDQVIVDQRMKFVHGRVGIIKGMGQDLPIVGASYIVDLGEPISEDYPFSSLTIPESYLIKLSSAVKLNSREEGKK